TAVVSLACVTATGLGTDDCAASDAGRSRTSRETPQRLLMVCLRISRSGHLGRAVHVVGQGRSHCLYTNQSTNCWVPWSHTRSAHGPGHGRGHSGLVAREPPKKE